MIPAYPPNRLCIYRGIYMYHLLLSYEKGHIWNKDSKLMRFVIFKYKNPEALNNCLPIWKEVEKHVFQNATIKVTAYRGVTSEYWEAS